ncbi:MAG: signal recognition particle-docking protein FtsY [Chthonomonadales bacterium]|nr:signal recognition particle-docking protein FtsY [Chthonomonadales bacterium]
MRFGFVKSILQKVDTLVTGRGRIDEDLFEELEAALLLADVNVHTTQAVLTGLRDAVRENRVKDPGDVKGLLRESLRAVLDRAGVEGGALRRSSEPPTVYLVVGVNGVGKTTTIAKLAYRLGHAGGKVVLAAGDTFRAAAIDQLQIWADRVGCGLIKHRDGADPSAVVFDALQAARSRRADYVIADTAGRLHTRGNLMEELKKTNRVLERELGRPADECLLVLDATTGQNAISQARQFRDAVNVTGIVLAKLDGTARGGIVITIADELGLPIKLVGTGEKPQDLETFDANAFVDALLQ